MQLIALDSKKIEFYNCSILCGLLACAALITAPKRSPKQVF